jgi:ketosteroid isomerase-like protein
MGERYGEIGMGVAESALVADLTQLMREIDSFFCTEERDVAERYWRHYLVPEIERLFAPDVTIHSHYEGPAGRLLYEGYEGMHEWADDTVALFTRFVRTNTDWQPLGDDALLVNQHVEAVGRESGAEIELNLWLLWLVREGRVVSVRTFPDRFLAEAAAGAARLASDAARPPRG